MHVKIVKKSLSSPVKNNKKCRGRDLNMSLMVKNKWFLLLPFKPTGFIKNERISKL